MLKKILFLLLLCVVVYVAVTSVVLVPENSIAVVLEKDSGDVVQVCGSGWGYVWKGVFFWNYSYKTFLLENRCRITSEIPVYPLQALEGTHYSIRVPLTVAYKVNQRNVSISKNDVVNNPVIFFNTIKAIVKSSFEKALEPYMRRGYRRSDIERDFDQIFSTVVEDVKQQCGVLGIEIGSFNKAGMPVIPDERTYAMGLQYLNELRTIEKEMKKELIILQGNLKKEEIENKQLIQRLKAISAVVKNNSDLLRYLYIDKISGKVKVILSSDKNGIPFGLGLGTPPVHTRKRGEIDNLH